MRVRAGTQDLHGNVPDSSPVVLLVIDAINDFRFEDGAQVLADALSVAERIKRLKARTRRAGIPTVYVNDNFGRWRSDFRALISHCLRPAAQGRAVTKLLRPERRDYFVLKPKHSQDAYMRGYQLIVPADCVAARAPEDRRQALALMRRTLHADTRISTTLDLNAVLRRPRRKHR